MPTQRSRRFSVLDGMILIAGVAFGLAILKFMPSVEIPDNGTQPALRSWVNDSFSLSLYGPTMALMLVRLRRPRPILRRLIRQPGFAACVAVLTSSVFYDAACLMEWSRSQSVLFDDVLYDLVFSASMATEKSVPAILIIWSSLLLTRKWRPEPSWIDRLGRLLAVLWIATIFFQYAFGPLGLRPILDRDVIDAYA